MWPQPKSCNDHLVSALLLCLAVSTLLAPRRAVVCYGALLYAMLRSASFMRRKGAQVIVTTLGLYGTGDRKDGGVVRESCYALRSVTMGDDRRRDFSCEMRPDDIRRYEMRC